MAPTMLPSIEAVAPVTPFFLSNPERLAVPNMLDICAERFLSLDVLETPVPPFPFHYSFQWRVHRNCCRTGGSLCDAPILLYRLTPLSFSSWDSSR